MLFTMPLAFAHVTVAPKEAPIGATQRYCIRVPSEKSVPTIGLEVEFPARPRGQCRRGADRLERHGAQGSAGPHRERQLGWWKHPAGALSGVRCGGAQPADGGDPDLEGDPEVPGCQRGPLDRGVAGAVSRCDHTRATLRTCCLGGRLFTGGLAIIRCALAIAFLALCAAFDVSHAHALLERSEPAAGAVIAADRAPRSLSLWFTEPVQASSNSIAVLNSENRRVERLNARTSDQEPSRVDVDLGDLAEGAYLVRWRVTSSDDHVVRGSFWFVVGFAPTPPPAAQLLGAGKPPVSLIEIVARWLGLLALLGMTGTALFRVVVLARFEKGGLGRRASAYPRPWTDR